MYWYCVLLTRAPICTSWRAWPNRAMPGTLARPCAAGQYLGRAGAALGQRLQVDHDPAAVDGRIGAHPVIDGLHVGVGHDHLGELVLALDHGGIGDVLAPPPSLPDDEPVVLLREEALRDDDVEIDRWRPSVAAMTRACTGGRCRRAQRRPRS